MDKAVNVDHQATPGISADALRVSKRDIELLDLARLKRITAGTDAWR